MATHKSVEELSGSLKQITKEKTALETKMEALSIKDIRKDYIKKFYKDYTRMRDNLNSILDSADSILETVKEEMQSKQAGESTGSEISRKLDSLSSLINAASSISRTLMQLHETFARVVEKMYESDMQDDLDKSMGTVTVDSALKEVYTTKEKKPTINTEIKDPMAKLKALNNPSNN